METLAAPAWPHAAPEGTDVVAASTLRSMARVGKRVDVVALTCRDRRTGAIRRRDVVVKRYGSGSPATAARAMTALRAAGLRAPERVRLPEVVALERALLVEELAVSGSWARALGAGDARAVDASRVAAAALVRLQRAPAPETAGDCGAGLERLAAPAARAAPEGVVHDAVAAARAGAGRVASHGDYHLKNVAPERGVTWIVDWDGFAAREPAFDVGDALGQLVVMGSFGHGGRARGIRAARAFWRAYEEAGGVAPARRACVQLARAVLQSVAYKVELARLAGDAPPRVEPLVALARRALDAERPGAVLDGAT